MPSVQYIKEPGYVFDLMFIFCMHFNTQSFIDEMPDAKKRAEDAVYYEGIKAYFGPIPEELRIFFHRTENGRCFISTHYWDPHRREYASGFNAKVWMEDFRDHGQVVRRMIRFYLYTLSEEEIEECMQSKAKLFSRIKASHHEEKVKNLLYEFFIDHTSYIQILQYELIEKELLLRKYYQENYERLMQAVAENDFPMLRDSLSDRCSMDLHFLEGTEPPVYVSYCLLNHYHIFYATIGESIYLQLGVDYRNGLDTLAQKNDLIDLREFGNAIGDVNRMQIVELLLQRDTIVCKDLERIFDFSGSTAYHHITVLTKAKVLKAHNEGKTVLYSLNRPYIDGVIKALGKFSTKPNLL